MTKPATKKQTKAKSPGSSGTGSCKAEIVEAPSPVEIPAGPFVTVVKTAGACKLSPRGEGEILYMAGILDGKVYLRIADNSSGGRHSKEWLPVEAIRKCFTAGMLTCQPFKSHVFAEAFTGKIQQFHTDMRESHAPSTANRYLALMQRLYSLATQWSIVERNPARAVKKFRENNARERFLTREEIVKFLEALDTLNNRFIAAGFKFLLFTGLRKNEAFHLEWKTVNREAGTVRLEKTKSGKARTVILNALARQIIEEMWSARTGDHPFVFPGKIPNAPVANPQKPFEVACERAGIKQCRVHDLRHSFASLEINAGASLYDVQKLLGHASSQMTQRYAHLADESIRRTTEQVAAQISLGVG